MRVPVSSPYTNQPSNPKTDPCSNSSSNNNNNNNDNNTTSSHSRSIGFHSPSHVQSLCYEPTSVLDIRRSPSPVAGKPSKVSAGITEVVVQSQPNEAVEWDEQVLHTLDWDSIMRDLGLHDESSPPVSKPLAPPHHIPHLPAFPSPHPSFDLAPPQQQQQQQQHHHQLVQSDFDLPVDLYSTEHTPPRGGLSHFDDAGNWNVGFDFIEDLIRAADCFDSDNLQLAHVIVERLNQRLRCPPAGKPVAKALRRAALYFKEALQGLMSSRSVRMSTNRVCSWWEMVQTIRAYSAFSAMSPIPMFSHFTTTQALLEALSGSSTSIHVIDFDIGLGGQHASFMKELAERAESLRLVAPPVLRITAVVPEDYVIESRLVRENLSQFAQDLRIRFHIDFVPAPTFEMLSFKAVKFIEGEKTAVLLSPQILRRLDPSTRAAGLLADVRRISPAVVVFVDGEGPGEAGAASFRKNFVSSLEFYSMVLESLDASASIGGGGGDSVAKIETFLLRPKIRSSVEAAGRRGPAWREVFHGVGMRPVQLSEFAAFQAKLLLAKIQISGFQVGKRQPDQAELVLWWHDRPMVATSAWRC